MLSSFRLRQSVFLSLMGLMGLSAAILAKPAKLNELAEQWCGTSKENDRRIQTVFHTQRERARQVRQKDRDQPQVFQESSPIQMVDGVVLMEDDGFLTSNDHPFPIPEHTSIRFVPNSLHSYNVFSAPYSYETSVGNKVLDEGQPAVEVPLGFNFPVSGGSFSSVWLSSYGGISFGAPLENAQTYLAEVIWRNRLPRLCPMSSRQTKRAYFRTEANRAFFTWRWGGSQGFIDFQLVMDGSGEAIFCYRKLYRVGEGAILAITGQESWWDDEKTLTRLDNFGSIKTAEVLQKGDTNVLLFRVQVQVPGSLPEKPFCAFAFQDPSTKEEIWRLVVESTDNVYAYVLPENVFVRFEITSDSIIVTVPLESIVSFNRQFVVKLYWGSGANVSEKMMSGIVDFTAARDIRADFGSLPILNSASPLLNPYNLPTLNCIEIENRLTQARSEKWDSLAIYTTFDDDRGGAAAFATDGNPAVEGIGMNDAASQPYKPAKLGMGNIRDSIGGQTLSHEFGHNWLYAIRIMENGQKTHSLNPESPHPAAYVQTPAAFAVIHDGNPEVSTMGGGIWNENDNGTFTVPNFSNHGYSWTDLYLMGLAPPSDVPDWFYLRDCNPPQPNAYNATPGVTVTAMKVPVNIQQVIAAEGPRSPSYQETRKEFFVPFLLLHRKGEQITPEQLSRLQILRSSWKREWEKTVGGRANLNTGFDKNSPSLATAERLLVYSGDRQSAQPDQMLPEALVVSAIDNNSTPVMGATISWSIVRGSGTLPGSSTTTDEMGRSYMYFTPSSGCDPIVVVRASLEGKPAFVEFTFHFPITSAKSTFGIKTVAGTGIPGAASDGSLAAQSPLNLPTGLVTDVSGNLYLSESANHRVLKISPDGTIRRIAGTGEAGSGGDGQSAVNAKLNHPAGLALDSAGNLYLADRDNSQIRKVTPEGIIQRVAGPLLPLIGFEGDGGPATQARLWWPEAVAVDHRGNLYIADTFNQRVRKVDSSGIITTIAGRGGVGYSGDDGLATQAQLAFPRGVTVASTGEIYVADTNNHRVREIDLTGKISTFAGGGRYFPTQDSLPSEIFLKSPSGIVLDSAGNLYVGTEAQIVMISAGGQALQLGGGQQPGFSGDCVPSLSLLNQVTALALDSSGRLYLADQQNHRVRMLQRKDAISSFVPIVLSMGGMQGSFFTSELSLTNRGTADATISFAYTKAFGAGEGTTFDFLPAGRQRIFVDALQYLRSIGIPIAPATGQGGTLRVGFNGLASPSDGAVTVRTTTAVPQGRAGLAYAGIGRDSVLSGPAYLCGLRQNSQDRSNVAFQNVGGSSEGEITLQVTVFSGESLFSQTLPEITVAPGGFYQISGILNSNGLSLNNGYVRVDRIRGSAPYNAYGVINDQNNSDGSFIPPQPEAQGAVKGLTLPVIVEVSAFESELIIANWSTTPKTLNFEFHAGALETADKTAKFSFEIAAGRQVIISQIIDYLRQQRIDGIGPKGATYAGALFVTVQNGDCQGLFLGARTTAPGGGGAYGLFYTAVPFSRASTDHAWLLGLQQNAENRSNLAIVNTGEVDGSPSEFSIDIYDGATGFKAGSVQRTVEAKAWVQINSILTQSGIAATQGYACVRKTKGANPFIAYAVINDGGQPGERTGDGAFISSQP